MKIIGRILMISTLFLFLSGLMILGDNLLSKVPTLDRNGGGDRPSITSNGSTNGENQFRPPEGNDDDGGGKRNPSFRGMRWILSIMKNVGVMGVLVVLIVFPKSMMKKKKRKAIVQGIDYAD